MTFDTIIFHGDCPDGFCAAYIAKKHTPMYTVLVPATYGVPIDEAHIIGKHVVVVDFSWPREETLRLESLAASMAILDHHKTAEAALAGLDFCLFDMNRSGAQMSWDYFCRGIVRPWFIDYVADRDLWKWELPASKVVNAFIMTLPHTMEAWSKLEMMDVNDAIQLGQGARAQVEHYVEKVCAQAQKGQWDEYLVGVVNAAYPNCSDVGNQLCLEGAEVGLLWFVRKDGKIQFSLRSIGEIDVSVLAARYGGGGHRNAAGFELPLSRGMALLGEIVQ